MAGCGVSTSAEKPFKPRTTTSGRKSGVSAAIWIAAKRRSFEWRRIWPRWAKSNPTKKDDASAVAMGSPLALVGSYRCSEALERAAAEFAAASFGGGDALIVRSCRRTQAGLWAKILDRGRSYVSGERLSARRSDDDVHTLAAAGLMLDPGGGFVLVRNAARFPQACEIIERTGGKVGCI